MAFIAVRLGHVGRVWFMALDALGDDTVHGVARRTVKICVLALVFPQLADLLGMTGQAGIGHIVAERNLERGVGILVATQTSLQFKVGLPGVALVAFGDVILGCGAMARVTVEAGDRFVPGPGGSYIRGGICMALYAIIHRQDGFSRCRRARQGCKAENKRDRNRDDYCMPNPFHFHFTS
jgi:hypothetical protein